MLVKDLVNGKVYMFELGKLLSDSTPDSIHHTKSHRHGAVHAKYLGTTKKTATYGSATTTVGRKYRFKTINGPIVLTGKQVKGYIVEQEKIPQVHDELKYGHY